MEQIIRDLIEIAIAMEREKKRKEVKAKAELKAEEKVLDALVGNKGTHFRAFWHHFGIPFPMQIPPHPCLKSA